MQTSESADKWIYRHIENNRSHLSTCSITRWILFWTHRLNDSAPLIVQRGNSQGIVAVSARSSLLGGTVETIRLFVSNLRQWNMMSIVERILGSSRPRFVPVICEVKHISWSTFQQISVYKFFGPINLFLESVFGKDVETSTIITTSPLSSI
ncbi:hypothetical protein BLNAU_17273 [Blattamonas nauphoetae]|uniref:Uncharacterized protein n=1 Tax=Blattamonas nauphoetae TaxID=2049346 RepID=A0ABQ9XA62_9EUKA|nr:hypothetical protein BLNAU_21268 [Blattamonas nauphoetae]KAK2947754.1 hypothetical protein BLNAU_17273 [Blattamonas nauphoetae]